MTTSKFTLNNGIEIPAIGLGVFQTLPDETVAAVASALRTGYRHIDTAAAYGNEREVGQGIRDSSVLRKDVFIESKVWISDFGYGETLHAFEKSAGKLGVDTIDLLILHSPLPSDFEKTVGAYKALEDLLAKRKVRAIGVSNFIIEHLTRLLEQTDIVPAVNQIELHPYFQQKELVAFQQEHGITTQAWSPIGGVTSYGESAKRSFDEPVILAIGEKYGKSAAQVMLRWHFQKEVQVIPKSTRAERIAENFDVFDFELAAGEIAQLDALDTGVRGGPEPEGVTVATYGFEIPEA